MLGWDVNDRMVGCDDSDVTARFKGLAWTRQPLAILFRFESSRKDWKKQQASFQRLGKIWTTTEPRQLKLDERRQLSNEGPDLASSLSAVYLKDLFEFSIKAIIKFEQNSTAHYGWGLRFNELEHRSQLFSQFREFYWTIESSTALAKQFFCWGWNQIKVLPSWSW